MSDVNSFLNSSLQKYLEDLSAHSIIPGGGSAAAVVGALGAGLNLMVINYSDAAKSKELVVLKAKQAEILKILSELVDEDCKVFKDLMDSPSQEKYARAAKVPMEVCRLSRQSMEITVLLLQSSNKNLLTDVGCAAHMLKAAFSSAALNVRVNLKNIEDEKFVQETENELAQMKKEIEGAAGEIILWLK